MTAKHQPTDDSRRMVKGLAGLGINQDDICRLIQVTKKTLHKHYRDELDHGMVEAEIGVKESAYRLATGKWNENTKRWDREPNVAMCIFLLKARYGWKESVNLNVNQQDESRDFERKAIALLNQIAAAKRSDAGLSSTVAGDGPAEPANTGGVVVGLDTLRRARGGEN